MHIDNAYQRLEASFFSSSIELKIPATIYSANYTLVVIFACQGRTILQTRTYLYQMMTARLGPPDEVQHFAQLKIRRIVQCEVCFMTEDISYRLCICNLQYLQNQMTCCLAATHCSILIGYLAHFTEGRGGVRTYYLIPRIC